MGRRLIATDDDQSESLRKTRSGTVFSPWAHIFGTPWRAPHDFDLDAHVKAASQPEYQPYEDGDTSLVHDLLSAVGAASSSRPDPLPSCAAKNKDATLPPADCIVFSASPMAANAERALATASTTPSASPSVSQPHAPKSKLSPTPGQQSHQPKVSKDTFHAKQRSKRRQQEKRAQAQAQLIGESVGRRPVKAIARRRRAAALSHVIPGSLDRTAVPAANDMTVQTGRCAPNQAAFSLEQGDLPVAKSAFIATWCPLSAGDHVRKTCDQLVSEGFRLIQWDGIQCWPVVDRNGRVFAVLGGQPRDRSWEDINSQMGNVIARSTASYTQTPLHRRGHYIAVTTGISFGGGQEHISNLVNDPATQKVLDSLLQQSAVRWIASFQNSIMRLFAPWLHAHYAETLDALCARHPELRRNCDRSDFACITFNMGPRTTTIPHCNHLNLPFGWCAITALGDFDPELGGHLVLWDLRMLIEFPPASTILIPSAILTHSNIDIGSQEWRYSLTQYSAGGLFRRAMSLG
ncbi:hypothetical protein BN946_scf185007.g180 [Trametes cinnabarina]|uniref:Uncharacterized protein n=1 Tax=Pycnoporus cinnabarinus TaxID=5643 RepID=A0A060SFX5_PYCCI|nr:hypothetical protein BN946_scf185007.g180 [Trametes cinnabarina]